jgi:exopolysaccharide production protein ExoY
VIINKSNASTAEVGDGAARETHRNDAISPIITSGRKPCTAVVKRCFDVLLATLGLVLLAPLLAIIAIVIVLTGGGLPIFSHQRCGHNGRLFQCYKFRTIVIGAGEKLSKLLAESAEAAAEWAQDHKLGNDPRITWFGRFLRQSSLDELPQLINVLKGEMSLVGPRPIMVEEIERYGELFGIYSLARPGITGLWLVSGRNHTSYQKRVELDARYVREWSFLGDMWIILKSLPAVLFSHDAFSRPGKKQAAKPCRLSTRGKHASSMQILGGGASIYRNAPPMPAQLNQGKR